MFKVEKNLNLEMMDADLELLGVRLATLNFVDWSILNFILEKNSRNVLNPNFGNFQKGIFISHFLFLLIFLFGNKSEGTSTQWHDSIKKGAT